MSNQPKKAGVMGWPISHSLSPKLHGYWLEQTKIVGSYEAMAVSAEQLGDKLKALPSLGYRGVNLTLPHKEAALSYMDRLDPVAERIGAVNTVVVGGDGKLEGRNTDVYGFSQNLALGGYKKDHRPVVVLGAGGAARAALLALQDLGVAEIRLLNRTKARAETLALNYGGKIHVGVWGDKAALKNCGLLVNATSLGLKGQPPLDLSLNALPIDAVVTDMVYAPLMTDLLKAAHNRGNKIIDGLGMLLHQARPAFKAFFGVDVDVTDELRRHIVSCL